MGLDDDEEVAIDEKVSFASFMYKHMTDNEKAILAIEKQLPDKKKGPIKRFYLAISINPDETNVAKTFLTSDSVEKGVNKYFGHKCTFFGQRLYAVLAKGRPLWRVYFNEFIEGFYNVMIDPLASNRSKSSFIFSMMDFDMDGKLGVVDLLKTFEKCSFDSKFGVELRKLILWYSSKNISDVEPVPGLK
jgi:hypothetical protein